MDQGEFAPIFQPSCTFEQLKEACPPPGLHKSPTYVYSPLLSTNPMHMQRLNLSIRFTIVVGYVTDRSYCQLVLGQEYCSKKTLE